MDITEHLTNDILDNRTMSIGRYIVDKNTILLKDKVQNFEMKLIILNDSLKLQNSFGFLSNRVFGLKSSYVEMQVFNWLKDIDSTSVKKDKEAYKSLNPTIYPLKLRKYTSYKRGFRDYEYYLTLNKNNTYRLCFTNLTISEGNWTRNGVELILHDNSLKHNFYLMIGNKVLISRLLPGDYEPTTLNFKL